MKAIVVTDQAAGTAGMKLVERPEPQGAALASLSGANYGDVVVEARASGFTGMSCRGPRPGSIASAVTGRRRSPATSWPEWSPPSPGRNNPIGSIIS